MSPIPKVRTTQDARWSCEGCGLCCRFHELGPVEPEIIQGLKDKDIGAHWAPAAKGDWFTTKTDPDGQTTTWLAKRGGACVFLTEQNRCAVHASFGAEAKPGFCRAFPFVAVRDPLGIALALRSDCEAVPLTATMGQPVAEQVEALMAIPNSRMFREFAPASVVIHQGFDVPLERWMALETRLLSQIRDWARSPEALAAGVRGLLVADTQSVHTRPDPERYKMALGAVLQALRMVMDHVIAREQAPNAADAAFAVEMRQAIGRGLAGLGAPLPPLTPEAEAVFNLGLRNLLLGKRFVGPGSVAAGVGLFLLNATVARFVIGGTAPITPTQLAQVHPRWTRFTHNQSLSAILRKARPALEDLWWHAS